MRPHSLSAALIVLLAAGSAVARPVEDGTRITIFGGGRYVPHHHFEQEAQATGTPVLSSQAFGPMGLASFSYAPQPSVELSLELGYASDKYKLSTGDLSVQNVPIVATLRWMPLEGRFNPYVGAGGGYMLAFVGGAGAGTETETHAQEFHLAVGATFELSSGMWLNLEDRQMFAAGDIIPIGQLQTGGNALMLGLSFVLEPARSLAPHDLH